MLNIYYQNVGGMRTKTNNIYTNILLNNYDIIAFTETWLNSNIFSSEVIDKRYTTFRRDRLLGTKNSKKDGGGLLLAISKDIKALRVQSWESVLEDLWVIVDININRTIKKIAICLAYLPPPIKLENLSLFLNNVNNVLNIVDDVMILGDFNLGFIKWARLNENKHCTIPSAYHKSLGYALIDFISLNNLYQFNDICNSENRVLDLVLSNVENVTVTSPPDLLSKLDPRHPGLLVSISHSSIEPLKPCSRSDGNFFKADYVKILLELKIIDWNHRFSQCNNVNEMVSEFYLVLNEIINKFVPKHSKLKSKYPSWFSFKLIKLLREKDKVRLKYRKYKNPRDGIVYETLRCHCHKLMKSCYSTYKQQIEDDIIKNPKAFWRYINDKRKGDSSLPSCMYMNGLSASTGPEIANLFARQFSSVYSHDSGDVTEGHTLVYNVLSKIQFTEREVLNKLKKLDTLKGSGPDSIPPIFVLRCCHLLALPLTLIFNRSLDDGTFPDVWKIARIVPVLKKNDPTDVKNYRPISLLSCIPKVFESLVNPVISHHVNKFISPCQHGFKTGRTVQTNLVQFVSDISHALDKRLEVDAVYTDFSSAFDTVNHSLLLSKLAACGIHGSLLKWLTSYLQRRSQVIAIKGYISQPYYAISGVPQGSHLAPVLFSLFINDLTAEIRNCKFLMFADDLKIYRVISERSDTNKIQNDLNRIQNWCSRNFMALNTKKCYHIKFSRKKTSHTSTYKINDTILNTVNEIRDLGVIMDDKLNFKAHIDSCVKRSAQMLGFIKRNTKGFQSSKTKTVLYNALVRSRLEYASIVWNPFYTINSQRVESIQRAFTRHLAFVSRDVSHRSPYERRLSYFKMASLRERRTMHSLIFLHKLMNGQMDCSELLSRISINVPYKIPRYPITTIFQLPTNKTNIGLNSPLVRICRDYNSFTKSVQEADINHDSRQKFRSRILKSLSVKQSY